MPARPHSDFSRLLPAGTPAIVMFAVLASASLLFMGEMHPLLPLAVAIPLVLLTVFYLVPIAGIYAWLLLFPIQSVYIALAVGWRVHRIYSVEVLALIILPLLVVKVLADNGVPAPRAARPADPEFSWIFFFSAAFIAWSALCLLLSKFPNEAIISWWRLIGDFVMAAFLLICLDRYEKFIKLIVFFCGIAAVFSIIAIYSNHYGMDLSYRLIGPGPVALRFVANFLNVSGNYDPKMVGMAFSSGLSARHELGIFLSSATVFSLFLMHQRRSLWVRAILLFMILLYATTELLTIPKGSLLGFVGSILFLCLIIPELRKFLLPVILGMAGLFAVGSYTSNLFKPLWMKAIGLGTSVTNLAGQSAFKPGTIGNRLKLMGEAVDLFLSSNGLGGGPDSLLFLKIGGVHGHSLFLSFAADYGVPGVLFAVGILVLLGKLAYKRIVARPQTGNPIWLLRFAILASLLMSVFEYSFDCYIWYPHVWFIGALFLASLRIDDNGPGGELIKPNAAEPHAA